MSEDIRPIYRDFLDPQILEGQIYPDLEHHYYWTDDWSPSFYAALARAGFISVCHDWGEPGVLLMPEIQREYAVLDWNDRHCPRSLGRKLRSGWVEDAGLYLRITGDTEPVANGIARSYGAENWLLAPYRTLMASFSDSPVEGFALFAVELRSERTGELVAGEMGYTLGATWTSLSGFVADRGRFSGAGTLQMLALSLVLEKLGYDFWNFGHPYMQYKLDLGCRILPRREFLSRWLPAVESRAALSLAGQLGVKLPCGAILEQIIEQA